MEVRLFFAVEDLHLVRVVAGAGDGFGRNGGFNRGDLGRRERNVEGGEALSELGASTCADDRDDGRALGEDPGDGELGLRDAFAGGDFGEAGDEFADSAPGSRRRKRGKRLRMSPGPVLEEPESRPRDRTP